MNTIIKLAWRNIWRNKRRTFITAASIVLAVLLSNVMTSMQKGTWDNMVDSVVNTFFGYAQIHANGYWEEQTLDKAFQPDDKLNELGVQVKSIESIIPRLESFALASYETKTQGVLVIGIDPVKENDMTGLEKKMTAGQFLAEGDNAVLVGEGVAENMKLGIGDTLVLLSQGYRGVNAAGKYPIKGLVRFGSPQLNKQMVYMPLPIAQQFFGAEDLVTTMALKIGNKKEVEETIKAVKTNISPEKYEVLNWEEMIPDLVQARELDTASNKFVLYILYLIVGFGIFGTILMMTKEREYEFGVLTAIGMQRNKLSFMVWLETTLLGLFGSVVGILLSIPIVYYMYSNPIQLTGEMASAYDKFGVEPIMKAVFDPQIFLQQAIIIFIITTILAIYPIWKIRNLKAVEMMRA